MTVDLDRLEAVVALTRAKAAFSDDLTLGQNRHNANEWSYAKFYSVQDLIAELREARAQIKADAARITELRGRLGEHPVVLNKDEEIAAAAHAIQPLQMQREHGCVKLAGAALTAALQVRASSGKTAADSASRSIGPVPEEVR